MINKKAQISIEVTIVLAILVIGAVFLGVYYVSNANRYREEAGRLDDNLNKLDSQGEFGEEERIDPTCSDGIQNQGEEGVDCGDVCENVCAPDDPDSPFTDLSISVNPDSYIINQPFTITVKPIFNDSTDYVQITELFILNNQSVTNNCFSQTGELSTVGKYINLGSASEFEPLTVTINGCDEPGTYTFKFVGEYQGHTEIKATQINITDNTFSSVVLSPSQEDYYTNTDFDITIETNIGDVNITNFNVNEEVGGSLFPTPNCTVDGSNSANGEFVNVGVTDPEDKTWHLIINCNIAGKYSFNAIGEYLGVEKTSNRLPIEINNPPVLALSIEPTPKIYGYIVLHPLDAPIDTIALNLTSNYNAELYRIKVRKRISSDVYQLTNELSIPDFTLDQGGHYKPLYDTIITSRGYLCEGISSAYYGDYEISFSVEKDGIITWSPPTYISVDRAGAYISPLTQNINSDFTIQIYPDGIYDINNLYIEKKIGSGYNLTQDCSSGEGEFQSSGNYINLGTTTFIQPFGNIISCERAGNYRFTYVIDDSSGNLVTLQPLYITVE